MLRTAAGTYSNLLLGTNGKIISSDGSGFVWTDPFVGNTAITAGTGTKITYDSKGLVTSSTTLSASDIPNLDVAKITTGIFNNAFINWANPGNIGTGTVGTGAFSTLNSTSHTSGTVNATTLTTGTLNATTLGSSVNLNNQVLTNANIDGGAIDGTVIGGSSAAAGSFTTLNAEVWLLMQIRMKY